MSSFNTFGFNKQNIYSIITKFAQYKTLKILLIHDNNARQYKIFSQNMDKVTLLTTRTVELFIYQYGTQQKIKVSVYHHFKFDCD